MHHSGWYTCKINKSGGQLMWKCFRATNCYFTSQTPPMSHIIRVFCSTHLCRCNAPDALQFASNKFSIYMYCKCSKIVKFVGIRKTHIKHIGNLTRHGVRGMHGKKTVSFLRIANNIFSTHFVSHSVNTRLLLSLQKHYTATVIM